MKFRKNDADRRLEQNYRIINKDCPWLWAIRNAWYPGGSTRIIVKNNFKNPNLLQFLLSRDSEGIEVWVRYGNYGAEEEACIHVERIDNSPEWNVNWACKIQGMLFSGYDVYDIVVVQPSIRREDLDWFTIYRIKRSDRYNFRLKLNMFAGPDLFPRATKESDSKVST